MPMYPTSAVNKYYVVGDPVIDMFSAPFKPLKYLGFSLFNNILLYSYKVISVIILLFIFIHLQAFHVVRKFTKLLNIFILVI